MRNVLAVINTPTFGGPHNQLLQLNANLEQLGWHYIAVLPDGDDDEAAKRLISGGVEVIRTPLHRLRALRSFQPHFELAQAFPHEVARLRELIRLKDASVVQVCGTVNVQPALAAHRERRGVVWQLLSNFAPWPLRAMMTPVIGRIAQVVMTTGLQTARQHAGLTMLAREIVPFFPPVNISKFKPDMAARRKARTELGVPQDAFLIGTVGNFNRQKAHERLIRASPYIFQRIPDSFIRILGAVTPAHSAYYQSEVIGLAEKLDLLQGGRLAFLSPGSRVHEFLPAFDVFILTSRSEGIPTAILEAMATGIPVVSVAVGSIPEVLSSGSNGFLLENTNPERIVAALEQLVSRPELLQTMSETARQTAIDKFSVEICARIHASAFSQASEAAKERYRLNGK